MIPFEQIILILLALGFVLLAHSHWTMEKRIGMPPKRNGNHATAIVLTALSVEFKAVRAHLKHCHPQEYRGTFYEVGTFSTRVRTWQVALAQIGVGNVSAAVEIERAITCFQPSVVFFVGIAGGVKDVAIGDVVVATRVYGYESGKATEQDFLSRPDVGETSYRLIQQAQVVEHGKTWITRAQKCTTRLLTHPRVWIGPIASGEKIASSARSDLAQLLLTVYNDTLAVEMEARGVLKAIHINGDIPALVIRGISDLLDGKHLADASGSQECAARNASAFTFELLARLDPMKFASPYSEEMHVHS